MSLGPILQECCYKITAKQGNTKDHVQDWIGYMVKKLQQDFIWIYLRNEVRPLLSQLSLIMFAGS